MCDFSPENLLILQRRTIFPLDTKSWTLDKDPQAAEEQ